MWSAMPAPAIRPRFQPRLKPPAAVRPREDIDSCDRETVDLERLVVTQLSERPDVASWRDHEVPGGVRELVQQRNRRRPLEHAKRFGFAKGAFRLEAKHAAFLLVGLCDVLEPPRRPKRLRHGAFLPPLAATTPTVVDSFGMSYALKLGGAAVAILILGVIGILIFDAIWMRTGLGAAIVVVCGGLLVFAWMTDRKDKAKRAGLDDLPDV